MNQPTAPEMRRPYAPTSNVIAVIQRGRSRTSDRVDDDFLNLAGVNTTGSIGVVRVLRLEVSRSHC